MEEWWRSGGRVVEEWWKSGGGVVEEWWKSGGKMVEKIKRIEKILKKNRSW